MGEMAERTDSSCQLCPTSLSPEEINVLNPATTNTPIPPFPHGYAEQL